MWAVGKLTALLKGSQGGLEQLQEPEIPEARRGQEGFLEEVRFWEVQDEGILMKRGS